MSELNFTHSNGNKVKLATPDTLAANKTFKLPGADGSAGEFLKTDGNGALSFATPTTNTGSLQVLEQFYLLADGRSVSTANGTVTTTNVTSSQPLTDVYAVMDGSKMTYQPPTGTTDVIYEYRTVVSENGSNNRLLYGWYLAIDNTMITQSREVYMNATGGYVHDLWVKQAFKVNTGGSDSSTTGDRAGLPSMELKVLCRRWSSTYPANAHFVTHFPPNATSNLTKKPHVGITAIGSVV